MDIKRSVTILLPEDADLRATVVAFQRVQQALSETAYNAGEPLSALALHRVMYAQVVGALNSQMTCSAIRLTAGAYASATGTHRPAQRPFRFTRARALFLVGKRGRDADFRADGTLSLWTVAGRKRLVQWAPAHAVLVFEALNIPQPKRGVMGGTSTRRRLSQWQRGLIRTAAERKAQEVGMAVAEVNPAYTSQQCSRCGLRGRRKRHAFTCPSCGHTQHADINAAVNIRNRYTALRSSGQPVSLP